VIFIISIIKVNLFELNEFKMAELATIQVTTDQFVGRATEYLIIHIKDAIAKSEHCVLGLSGGSTPKDIYATLAKSTDFDWSKLYIFLVDDRYVPASHDQSNQKLIADSGLANKVLPEHYIFPNTNLELKECIADYDHKIKTLFSNSPADIITLGLGDDGHIASLFPHVVEEGFKHEKLVIHTTTDKFAIFDRITLVLQPLQASKNKVFFMKGEAKLKVWEEMIHSPPNSHRWPAQLVISSGNTTLIIA